MDFFGIFCIKKSKKKFNSGDFLKVQFFFDVLESDFN